MQKCFFCYTFQLYLLFEYSEFKQNMFHLDLNILPDKVFVKDWYDYFNNSILHNLVRFSTKGLSFFCSSIPRGKTKTP